MKTSVFLYSFLLAIVLTVTGCSVTKETNTANIQLPATFRDQTNLDTTSIAGISWKVFLQNAELEALIATALLKNNELQIAIKNINAADQIFKQAKSGYFPTVGLSANASLNNPSNNSLNGLSINEFLGRNYLQDFTVGAGLSWEADIWGKIKNQKKEALANYLKTSEASKAIQTVLVASIANAYYNLLTLDKQLNVARKNLLLNDSTLRILNLQFTSGQVTSLAVQQVEAQKLVASQFIPQIEQDIAVQENALSVLTGIMPGAIQRNRAFDELQIPFGLTAGVPSAMVGRRPDVKSYELELQAASAKVGYTKASMYPSFSITASGGLNSLKASNWFTIPASLFGTAAAGLTQPLFQKRQLKTQYEVAKIQREQSVFRFRQSVLVAVEQVSDALVRIEKLQLQQAIAANRVDLLQKATGNANLLFANGMANYLEVITAQSNVLSGELELASIKRAQLNAVINLYQSLGGGWQ